MPWVYNPDNGSTIWAHDNPNDLWGPADTSPPIKPAPAPAPTAPQSGEGGGGEGLDLSWLEGIFSSSKSGLPDWGSAWAKDWLNTMTPIQTGTMEAFNQLKNAPNTIEQTRQNMVNQYRNAMDYNLNQTMKPAVSNLASRGVLSSSTAEGTLAKVLQDLQNKYSDQVTAANTWAGNALLENLYKTLSAYQGQGSLITSLLSASREGSSQDPWQPFATILPYLLSNMG